MLINKGNIQIVPSGTIIAIILKYRGNLKGDMKNRALLFGSGFGGGGCHEDLGIGHFNHRCHNLIFQRSNLIQYTFKAEVPAYRVLSREMLSAIQEPLK